jgi:hypothetical protein
VIRRNLHDPLGHPRPGQHLLRQCQQPDDLDERPEHVRVVQHCHREGLLEAGRWVGSS